MPLLPFAREMIDRFKSRRANVFLLSGNIHDLFPVGDRHVRIEEYLEAALFNPPRPPERELGPIVLPDEESSSGVEPDAAATVPSERAVRPSADELGARPRPPASRRPRKVVITYDVHSGLVFTHPDDRAAVASLIGADILRQSEAESRQNPILALTFLSELCLMDRDALARTRKDAQGFDLAVVIRFARAVAPAGDNASLATPDRQRVVLLEQWFTNERFFNGADIVVLVTDQAGDISAQIARLPQVSLHEIGRPDDGLRRGFVRHLTRQHGENLSLGLSEDQAVFFTGGLKLFDIQQIFLDAVYRRAPLTLEHVFGRMREILQSELGDFLEVLDIPYGFERVVGAGRVLVKLREFVTLMQSGDPALMPTGLLVPGANGVGKTFVLKAFIRETGWLGVVIKNLRGSYVGETERNFERVRSVLQAMGRVVVLYDEADTEIGGRGQHTHDTDKRLFGGILRMMSDEANRGRIVWLIVTARPDKLEPDVKRSGRAGEHISFFDPEGDEREQFVRFILRRAGIDAAAFDGADWRELMDRTTTYSAADFNQWAVEIRRLALLSGESLPDHALEACADFIPTDISIQRRLQELLALLECTDRRLIPDKWADYPKSEIQSEVMRLKAMLGEV